MVNSPFFCGQTPALKLARRQVKGDMGELAWRESRVQCAEEGAPNR